MERRAEAKIELCVSLGPDRLCELCLSNCRLETAQCRSGTQGLKPV